MKREDFELLCQRMTKKCARFNKDIKKSMEELEIPFVKYNKEIDDEKMFSHFKSKEHQRHFKQKLIWQ